MDFFGGTSDRKVVDSDAEDNDVHHPNLLGSDISQLRAQRLDSAVACVQARKGDVDMRLILTVVRLLVDEVDAHHLPSETRR